MEKWTKNWPNTYFSLEFGQKNYALLLLRQNNRKSTFQFRKCINGFILNDLLMFIFFQIFHYSVKNGCQWYDCLSTADQGTKVAMATNILKISVQKLQTRFHYFYTSAINVRIISTNIILKLLFKNSPRHSHHGFFCVFALRCIIAAMLLFLLLAVLTVNTNEVSWVTWWKVAFISINITCCTMQHHYRTETAICKWHR